MNDKTKLTRGAEYYATTLNWHVFPCHGVVDGRCTCGRAEEPGQRGKHPATPHGQNDATTDAATVAGWWATNPDYNVGVFCKPSGFFVIDIDPRSGGFESFEKFEELLNWNLPETVEAETGVYSMKGREVRGRHLYYKYDGNEKLVGNLKEAKLPGIDIKHDGYVLAPPSIHASGAEYNWKPGHAPWEIEMAEPSKELLDALVKRTKSGARVGTLSSVDWSEFSDGEFETMDLDKEMSEDLPEGNRAVGIYRMACSLANKVDVSSEVGRAMVETTMIRYNAEKVKPPLPLEGIGGLLSHVHRAIEFVQNNPKTALIPQVEEWQKEAAAKMQAGTFRNATTTMKSTALGAVNSAPATPAVRDAQDALESDDMYTAPGTVGGAVAHAAAAGMSVDEATRLTNIDVPKDPDALTAEEGGTPGARSLSDVGNGRRIVDSFGSVIRYTPGIGWFNWSGTHWKFDMETLNVREQSKKIAAIISSEAMQYDENSRNDVYKWANQARSASRITAAIEAARPDPRVRVAVSEWDADPYLLGVKNGVVDLRTGELFMGRPDLNITKHSPVAYVPGAVSARWTKFLNDATNGDTELQDWIQRAAGYTLTGLNHLDHMFMVYGPPGSGKNTAIEAFVKCLGTADYAWPLDSEVLGDNKSQTGNTVEYHWAKLVGKRMVWADELPEGERMKENQVKKLTGSSEISARHPGESPFTFTSQAKLWLTTNHRPMIFDDAMWRRIRPIPWSYVPEMPDPSLKEYLFDPDGGLPAVLAWMVEGAIKFLSSPNKDGLGWCKAVYNASEEYRQSEDRIGLFFMDKMVDAPGGSVRLADIHNIYRMWSQERGENPLSVGKLQRKLADRGYAVNGNGASAVLHGYALAKAAPPSSSSVADAANTYNGPSWL